MAQRRTFPTESDPILLSKISVDTISIWRPTHVTLDFSPSIPAVQVHLKLKDHHKNLHTTCKGLPKNSPEFKFDFAGGNSRRQRLALSINDPTSTLKRNFPETLIISCSDGKRRQVSNIEVTIICEAWFTGIPVVEPIARIWLAEIPSWMKTVLLILVGLTLSVWVLTFFKINPLNPISPSGARTEATAPKPEPYSLANWVDRFDNEGDLPNPLNWDCQGWKLGTIDNNPLNKALFVSGIEVGLIKLQDEHQALYDCTVSFVILVAENQGSASWIVRAKDKKSYYMFQLIFPTNETKARLDGYIYADGQKLNGLINGDNGLLEQYEPFGKGDQLKVEIEIKGSTITHTFLLEDRRALPDEHGQPQSPPFNRGHHESITRRFNDFRYSYGRFGFNAVNTKGEMRIQDLEIEVPVSAHGDFR